MPTYFFHVINGSFMPDELGTECATPEDVKNQAIIAAGEMLKDQGLGIWKTGRWDMFVADEQNKTHLKLSFTAEDLTGR
jgi:hypothetical protein